VWLDGTLLGIGRAGDDAGALRGVKLALFDVTDLREPREVAALELGGRGSTTAVSDDHRALLYDPRRRLLVLPVTERHGWSCDAPTFHGAKAFTLDLTADGGTFTARAAIEHGPNRSSTWRHGPHYDSGCAQPCAAATVRRALYVGEQLFTISDGEVRATSLESYAPLWSAPLHLHEPLAADGSCTLDGASLPWARVGASGHDVWCGSVGSPPLPPPRPPAWPDSNGGWPTCEPADRELRYARCPSMVARRSFDALLDSAAACCGTEGCASGCGTAFDGCRVWF